MDDLAVDLSGRGRSRCRRTDHALPGAAADQRRRRRRRVPRLGPRHDRDPDRPRALQPDAEPLARRPSPADQRRPRGRPAIRRGRRAVVRDALRAGRADRLVPVPGVPAADRDGDAGGPRGAPGDGCRRLAGCRARQDPPRAPDRRDGECRRAAAHAVLRIGRLHAALADPPRGHVRLDGRPRVRRPVVAARAARPSSGSTGTGIATTTDSSSTSDARTRGSSTRAGRTLATRSGIAPAASRPSPWP